MIQVQEDVLVEAIVEELRREFGVEYYETNHELIEEAAGPALARRVLARIQEHRTPIQPGGNT